MAAVKLSSGDPRQSLLQLLATYNDTYPDEATTIKRYHQFIESNVDCFERTLPIGHVTGSALILDSAGQKLLLTHHRKLDRWLQPGGHADGDVDVSRVAMKEALEESGLEEIKFLSTQILDIDIHEIPERGAEPAHYHYDCRFLLQSAGSDNYVISDESHDLQWVLMDQISDFTDEDSILRMIRKASNHLQH